MRAQHMLIQLGYGREMQHLNKIGHPTGRLNPWLAHDSRVTKTYRGEKPPHIGNRKPTKVKTTVQHMWHPAHYHGPSRQEGGGPFSITELNVIPHKLIQKLAHECRIIHPTRPPDAKGIP